LRLAVLLGIAVFLLTLFIRLPAAALLPLLPAGIVCTAAAGTIWSGSCAQLQRAAISISDVSWSLHPLALLRLHLAARVRADDPQLRGSAELDLARDGTLAVQALQASSALPGLWGPLPAGASGAVAIAIEQLQLASGHLLTAQGHIEVQQLAIANPALQLGNYELLLMPGSAGTAVLGELHDLGGALMVEGQLRLLRSGAYEISGSLAPRAGAATGLQQALQLLGPPDPNGRRSFSVAGDL
jgi:hypothetical protein